MHGGEIEGGRLVDVDIQAVVRLHLEGRLHPRFREGSPGPTAVLVARLPQFADFRQFRLGVVVLLRVVVAGNPPCGMVARHRKLGQFFHDPETDESVLNGKLVAEAQAVVIEPEADLHHGGFGFGGMVHAFHAADGLFQRHQHLIVVVADVCLFAPHRLPCLVEGAVFCVFQHKGVGEVVAPFEGETHLGGQHHGLPITVKGIVRHAIIHGKLQFQLSVRTLEGDGSVGSESRGKERCQNQKKKVSYDFHCFKYCYVS